MRHQNENYEEEWSKILVDTAVPAKENISPRKASIRIWPNRNES